MGIHELALDDVYKFNIGLVIGYWMTWQNHNGTNKNWNSHISTPLVCMHECILYYSEKLLMLHKWHVSPNMLNYYGHVKSTAKPENLFMVPWLITAYVQSVPCVIHNSDRPTRQNKRLSLTDTRLGYVQFYCVNNADRHTRVHTVLCPCVKWLVRLIVDYWWFLVPSLSIQPLPVTYSIRVKNVVVISSRTLNKKKQH